MPDAASSLVLTVYVPVPPVPVPRPIIRAPIGPPAEIIELQAPAWQPASGDLPDPQDGTVHCSAEGCRFADGTSFEAPGAAGFAQVGGGEGFGGGDVAAIDLEVVAHQAREERLRERGRVDARHAAGAGDLARRRCGEIDVRAGAGARRRRGNGAIVERDGARRCGGRRQMRYLQMP